MAARKLSAPGSLPGVPNRARPRTASRARRRQVSLALILGGALCTTLPAGAAVYRCQSDGAPTFAQFCAPADRMETQPADGSGAFLPFEPLSQSERQALEELSRELAATRRGARQRRQNASRQAQASRAEAAERCARARSALEALEAKRRKGYGVSEARRLKAQERELHAERRANC